MAALRRMSTCSAWTSRGLGLVAAGASWRACGVTPSTPRSCGRLPCCAVSSGTMRLAFAFQLRGL
eukprot:4040209-Heterocapsa_arctica.AAC.1